MKAALVWFLLIWGPTDQTSVQVTSEAECRAAVKLIEDVRAGSSPRATCVSVPFQTTPTPPKLEAWPQ